MIAVLFTILFAGTALFALAVIGLNARRYAPAVAEVRQQLRHCQEWRDVDVRIVTLRIGGRARVLRPEFPAIRRLPEAKAGLRAAA